MAQIYANDVDVDSVGGFDRVLKGSYLTKIHSVDEESDSKGKMIVDFEIICGTTPEQAGKMHREWFEKTNQKMAVRKQIALAIAGGLTTVDKIKAAKTSGEPVDIDYQDLIGKLVVINLEDNEYNGKTSTRIAWDEIYHPADKRVNHVPLNAGMLKAAGIVLPANRPVDGIRPNSGVTAATNSNGNGNGAKPAAKSAANGAKPVAAAMSVDDIEI